MRFYKDSSTEYCNRLYFLCYNCVIGNINKAALASLTTSIFNVCAIFSTLGTTFEKCRIKISTTMKKIIVLFALLAYGLSFAPKAMAQEFEDLLLLFVDEKYDKCFTKSIKYTQKDDTKKHPLPYLYASMSAFEMSQDHKYSDDFPKAYKTSLSFLAKYRKKDKTYDYKEDAHEFIEKMKMIIAEEVDNYLLTPSEKTYGKALGVVKKVVKFDPDDHGAKLLQGHLYIMTKNKTEGSKLIVEAMGQIDSIGTKTQFGDMTFSQQHYLKKALMEYANYQKVKYPAKAKETISKGHQFFYEKREDCLLEDNKDFIKVYDEITG